MKICAVFVVFKPETPTLEQTAYAESPKASSRWGGSLNAHTADAEVALVKFSFLDEVDFNLFAINVISNRELYGPW